MANAAQSYTYTDEQISAWLRGLLTIAWADGEFAEEEKDLVAELTQNQLVPSVDVDSLEPITPEDLAKVLGEDKEIAENFLRTAVMMALANGIYSKAEAKVVHEYHSALGLNIEALKSLEITLVTSETIVETETELELPLKEASTPHASPYPHSDILHPMKQWLEDINIHDSRVARFICKTVPSQCPFERDITVFGRKVAHIPPLCKLNPLYDQLVGLRFRALSYLADDCQEDISSYV